jgi:outer membrane murein-binding lipoprotein Lpp
MAERKASKPEKSAAAGAAARGGTPVTKGPPPKIKPTAQPAPKSAASSGGLQATVERLEAKVSVLKHERDRMAADLAAARAEIASLEKARRDAINRIDWVIDSLQTLLPDKT